MLRHTYTIDKLHACAHSVMALRMPFFLNIGDDGGVDGSSSLLDVSEEIPSTFDEGLLWHLSHCWNGSLS